MSASRATVNSVGASLTVMARVVDVELPPAGCGQAGGERPGAGVGVRRRLRGRCAAVLEGPGPARRPAGAGVGEVDGSGTEPVVGVAVKLAVGAVGWVTVMARWSMWSLPVEQRSGWR